MSKQSNPSKTLNPEIPKASGGNFLSVEYLASSHTNKHAANNPSLKRKLYAAEQNGAFKKLNSGISAEKSSISLPMPHANSAVLNMFVNSVNRPAMINQNLSNAAAAAAAVWNAQNSIIPNWFAATAASSPTQVLPNSPQRPMLPPNVAAMGYPNVQNW